MKITFFAFIAIYFSCVSLFAQKTSIIDITTNVNNWSNNIGNIGIQGFISNKFGLFVGAALGASESSSSEFNNLFTHNSITGEFRYYPFGKPLNLIPSRKNHRKKISKREGCSFSDVCLNIKSKQFALKGFYVGMGYEYQATQLKVIPIDLSTPFKGYELTINSQGGIGCLGYLIRIGRVSIGSNIGFKILFLETNNSSEIILKDYLTHTYPWEMRLENRFIIDVGFNF